MEVTVSWHHQTLRLQRVIGHAVREAQKLNHGWVGTEHILLGLLCEPEGIAAKAITNLGVKLDDVRREVLHMVEKK